MNDSEQNAKMQALELDVFKKYITEKVQLYLLNFEKVQANFAITSEKGWRLGRSYGLDGKKRAEDYLEFIDGANNLDALLMDVALDLIHNDTQSEENTVKSRIYQFGFSMWHQAKIMSGYAESEFAQEDDDFTSRLGSSRELAKLVALGYYNALQSSYLAKVNNVLSQAMKQQLCEVLNQCVLIEEININEGDLVLSGDSSNKFAMPT